MPRYDFKCDKCNVIYTDVRIPAEVVNDDPNWNKINCEECNSLMNQVFDLNSIPNFQFIGQNPPVGQQCKINRQVKESLHIAEQPIESLNELQAGQGMAKEEEKARGLAPNTILGGREAPTTKEGKEAIIKRDLVKKELSRKARAKSGF